MKLLKIGENDANQRLDKFLKKLLPNATKSLIYKLNRTNKIKIKKDPFFKKDDGLTLALEKEKKFKKRDNDYKLKI
jgi:23S rRNA pseudouridine955/2504/2580 synthase